MLRGLLSNMTTILQKYRYQVEIKQTVEQHCSVIAATEVSPHLLCSLLRHTPVVRWQFVRAGEINLRSHLVLFTLRLTNIWKQFYVWGVWPGVSRTILHYLGVTCGRACRSPVLPSLDWTLSRAARPDTAVNTSTAQWSDQHGHITDTAIVNSRQQSW